jgi:Ca2+-binding EF-hand superfamily protein
MWPGPPPTGGYPYPNSSGYPPPYPSAGYPSQAPPAGPYPPPYPSQGPYPPPTSYAPYPSQTGPYPPQTQYPPRPTGPYPSQGPATGPYPPPTPPQSHWYSHFYTQMNQNEIFELQKWFASVDRDGSGTISANELANVAVGGIRLGIDLAIKLVRIFDVDGSGSIEFREYASLHKFLISMQQVFASADKDRSGRLDSREIHEALKTGGFNIGFTTAQALHRKFDTTGYGLDMAQWIALVAHVAVTRSAFELRDKEKKGVITMNFDQLLEFSSQI